MIISCLSGSLTSLSSLVFPSSKFLLQVLVRLVLSSFVVTVLIFFKSSGRARFDRSHWFVFTAARFLLCMRELAMFLV